MCFILHVSRGEEKLLEKDSIIRIICLEARQSRGAGQPLNIGYRDTHRTSSPTSHVLSKKSCLL